MKKTVMLSVATALMATSVFSVADAAKTREKPGQLKVYQHSVKPKTPGSFQATTGGKPTYSQISGKRAEIFLKHAQVGNGMNYALQGNHSNDKVRIKIGVVCPAGQIVKHLAYQIGVQSVPVFENTGNTGPNIVKKTVDVVPFSNTEILNFARNEMGGGWQGAFPKNTRQKVRHTSMTKTIKLISSCSAMQSTKVKDYKIHIPLVKITDTDYD